MKKLFFLLIISALVFSCKEEIDEGKFTITGQIKNLPDQHIFLEELFFSEKNPEVLDTAEIKGGKFVISGTAAEQGLYRLRLENGNIGFIFINDKKDISFTADNANLSFKTYSFNSPANELLKNFIITVDSQQTNIAAASGVVQELKNTGASDSLIDLSTKVFDTSLRKHQNYIIKYIDTTTNPVMGLFALGYTQNMSPDKLEAAIDNLNKHFEGNKAIISVTERFKQMLEKAKAHPQVNDIAPEINMTDTAGKPFTLSSLKGKFVLVDFWASWCGPCRKENPNVVKAFNTFKNKNFTVLGVSLDKDKQAWINAIKQDSLTWQHISDLKDWSSAAVSSYGIESIPYNVLIDTSGKIIATELQGPDLEKKLAEVLK